MSERGGTSPDPLTAAAEWGRGGDAVALATVLKTWGSAPRQPGAQMCIRADRTFVGSVSGGCVEGAVIQEALGLIESGGHKLLEFGVSDEEAWEVGLACGGRVEVFVEALSDADWLHDVLSAREIKRGCVLAWDLGDATRQLLFPLDESEEGTRLESVARDALRRDRSERWEIGGRAYFLQVFNPPVQVVIVGAVHIAQPLAAMVHEAGFNVAVVDPREAFATEERFPNTPLHRAWPAEALDDIGIGHRTAIVTVTHDPKLDDPALQSALASPAFYVGALGSRRTHAKRVERLQEAGFEEDQIARIHAPVGLDIGARSPGEIAASVLAEIVRELRHPTA